MRLTATIAPFLPTHKQQSTRKYPHKILALIVVYHNDSVENAHRAHTIGGITRFFENRNTPYWWCRKPIKRNTLAVSWWRRAPLYGALAESAALRGVRRTDGRPEFAAAERAVITYQLSQSARHRKTATTWPRLSLNVFFDAAFEHFKPTIVVCRMVFEPRAPDWRVHRALFRTRRAVVARDDRVSSSSSAFSIVTPRTRTAFCQVTNERAMKAYKLTVHQKAFNGV